MTTFILAIAGCAFLFLAIWVATLTLPFKALARNFPKDVQERLKPRLDNLPMSRKRIIGGILTVLLCLGWLAVFIVGGIDGLHHQFSFRQFLVRFLVIGITVKAFDIICLDYFLLTKTHFFQHYLPETEGCAGWQQFGYNRKQQFRHCIVMLIGCLASALIFSIL